MHLPFTSRTRFASAPLPFVQCHKTANTMTVAGLPAALETLLTSLLASGEPTSWKVDGEPGNVVVVLRFRQREGQPLPMNNTRGYWKKKTDAQRKRDLQRAEQRRRGEHKPSNPFSNSQNVDVNVAKSVVPTCNDSRKSRPHGPTDCVTVPSLTSDPSNHSGLENAKKTTASVSDNDPDASDQADAQNDPKSAVMSSPGTKATIEDLREVIDENYKSMTRREQEHTEAVMCAIAKACASFNANDHTSSFPPTSESRIDPRTSCKRTSLPPPSRPPESTQPAVPPRSADILRSKNCDTTTRSRTPPTRQQPARNARKT